eukprot:s497_g35.t1
MPVPGNSWLRAIGHALGFTPCCCWDEAHETLHIVQLSTDALADPFDLNISPSHAESSGRVLATKGTGASPGEQRLREQIQLPRMRWFKLQGAWDDGVDDDEDLGEEEKKMALLQIYQDSVLDLLSGLELTVMAGNQEYVDSHCQLMPGFTSLKVDYGCDNSITEFPLNNVTKMYRVVKRRANTQLHLAEHHPRTSYPFPETDHIVIVEFVSRKLVFVFVDEVEAQRFLLCLELLTWQSQHDDRFDGYRERIIPLFDEELSGW